MNADRQSVARNDWGTRNDHDGEQPGAAHREVFLEQQEQLDNHHGLEKNFKAWRPDCPDRSLGNLRELVLWSPWL
jgi:hypothetical protein